MEEVMKSLIYSKVCKGGRLPMRYLPDPASQFHNSSSQLLIRGNMMRKKMDNKNEKLGLKISEIIKKNLRMLQNGGAKKMFKHLFNTIEGEQLLKASHCYISTTAGPIAGLLFISCHRVAFCSEKSIKLVSSHGKQTRFLYKIMIPLKKINRVNETGNVKSPLEKYIRIVTEDNFDFWFMRLSNYQKAFNYLQQAACEASKITECRSFVCPQLRHI